MQRDQHFIEGYLKGNHMEFLQINHSYDSLSKGWSYNTMNEDITKKGGEQGIIVI